MAIPFATEREDRVRARLEIAVRRSREVHAEEGELRVGNGIDEVANEVPALGANEEVFAAERYDAARRILARHPGDAVGMKAGAVDDHVGAQLTSVSDDPPSFAVGVDLTRGGRRTHDGAEVLDLG